MSAASKASHAVRTRYAAAILDLAQEQGKTNELIRDIVALRALWAQSSDFQNAVVLPTLTRKAQGAIVAQISKTLNCDALTAKFLGVLAQNRRLAALPEILQEIEKEIARRSGQLNVQVQSARAMDDKAKADLTLALGQALGCEVRMQTEIKPDILGGMIVTVGSRMIDFSVRRKLERLKGFMKRPADLANTKTVQQSR
ncbi:MAG: ATP synthase F1 subunit delta [Alphaproteobacteria bacterium]|nr:ATP synthase F1 subunit delta [Alphaproteobacteria bacterium]